MNPTRAAGWLSLVVVVAGCARAPSPPPAAAGASPPRESAQASPAPPSSPQQPMPSPTTAPAGVTPGGDGTPKGQPRTEAKKAGDFDDAQAAQRAFEDAWITLAQKGEEITRLSGSSCGDACRALASMERAARTVCDLVTPEERGRCDDATVRLKNARKRVRDACGSCPAGPTTDPDAPIR